MRRGSDPDAARRSAGRRHSDPPRPSAEPHAGPPKPGELSPKPGEQLPKTGEQLPKPGEQPPKTGEQLPKTGEQLPKTGEQLPKTGEQLPKPGEQLPKAGEQPPKAGEQLPKTGEQPPKTGEQLPKTGEQPPKTGEQPPKAGEQPPKAGEQLPKPGEQLPKTGEQLPKAGEQLPKPGEQLPKTGGQLPKPGEQPPKLGEPPPKPGEPPRGTAGPHGAGSPGRCGLRAAERRAREKRGRGTQRSCHGPRRGARDRRAPSWGRREHLAVDSRAGPLEQSRAVGRVCPRARGSGARGRGGSGEVFPAGAPPTPRSRSLKTEASGAASGGAVRVFPDGGATSTGHAGGRFMRAGPPRSQKGAAHRARRRAGGFRGAHGRVVPRAVRLRAVHRGGAARRRYPVGLALPDALDRKDPNAGREWPWPWGFPATRTYRVPGSSEVRRHHRHETVLQRAIRSASVAAGLTRAAATHVLNRGGRGARSPFDMAPGRRCGSTMGAGGARTQAVRQVSARGCGGVIQVWGRGAMRLAKARGTAEVGGRAHGRGALCSGGCRGGGC
jgi:hypothetical protein